MKPPSDTKPLCPECQYPIQFHYRLSDQVCVAQCANTDCTLECAALEGTGDTMVEAFDNFVGKSMLKAKR